MPNREMAEGRAQVVFVRAVVIGQLDDRVVGLLAVADESQGVLAGRHVALAQQLHAKQAGVESIDLSRSPTRIIVCSIR